MRDNLAGIVGRVQAGTDAIATASRQIAAGNLDLSSRTEQQASSLQETASSMEELTSTVKQNAENAQQASALAANASEVARAGEQGRGFAVIASEVRNLAQRSSSAAKEIKDLIGASVQKIRDGSTLAGEAGRCSERRFPYCR